jgi:indole-3-glycerol phosphate synthase
MIHAYQLHEAKAAGADVVLLIAAALPVQQVEELTGLAHELGLEVLLEVHSEEEAVRYARLPMDMIGVNNRDLNTFEVRLEVSEQLVSFLPASCVWISESGFQSPEDVQRIYDCGYRGFLLGEQFMRQPDPGNACHTLLKAL